MEGSNGMFKIRVKNGQFVGLNNKEKLVAVETSPHKAGEFQIVRNADQVQIKAPNGKFLQVQIIFPINASDLCFTAIQKHNRIKLVKLGPGSLCFLVILISN
jgi:hypothetical protein